MSKSTTARDVARYIVARMPRVSMGKLQVILFYASMQHYREHAAPMFSDVFVKSPAGPRVRSVTPDWLRRERCAQRRIARHRKSLSLRVRTWAVRMGQRYGADGISKFNVPGGWTATDATAQLAGMAMAARVGPAVATWMRKWVRAAANTTAPLRGHITVACMYDDRMDA